MVVATPRFFKVVKYILPPGSRNLGVVSLVHEVRILCIVYERGIVLRHSQSREPGLLGCYLHEADLQMACVRAPTIARR